MNFGQAIEALKEGKKLRCKTWDELDGYIYYVPETDECKAHIAMKTSATVFKWAVPSTGVLSDDWEIID